MFDEFFKKLKQEKNFKILIENLKNFSLIFQKYQDYVQKQVLTEYVKSINDWEKILSEEDKNKNSHIFNSKQDNENYWLKSFGKPKRYLFCYKTQKLIEFNTGSVNSIGDYCGGNTKITISKDGCTIYITNDWQTKRARFSHIPWVLHEVTYAINVVEKSVKIHSSR